VRRATQLRVLLHGPQEEAVADHAAQYDDLEEVVQILVEKKCHATLTNDLPFCCFKCTTFEPPKFLQKNRGLKLQKKISLQLERFSMRTPVKKSYRCCCCNLSKLI